MHDHDPRRRAPARLAGRIAGYFSALGAARRSLAEIHEMDDRLLRDIGFEREPLISLRKHLMRF